MANGTGYWIAGGVVAAGLIGLAIYDESEKSKCQKSGGTWQGLFKSPSCVTTPAPVSTAPSAPASVTVSTPQVTGANSWTALVSWSAVAGATSYQVILDGNVVKTVSVGTTSTTISGSGVGQNHSVAVAACN